jgi:uncharacterized delta-60 repeat protein
MDAKNQARAGEVEEEFTLPFKVKYIGHAVFGLARHAGGKLYLGLQGVGVGYIVIARLRADNTLDPDYGADGNGTVMVNFTNVDLSRDPIGIAMVLQDDGGVTLVVRDFVSGLTVGLVKINVDGRLDEAFGDKGVIIHTIPRPQSDGLPLVQTETLSDSEAESKFSDGAGVAVFGAGQLLYFSNSYKFSEPSAYIGVVAKFMPDGSRDQNFGEEGVLYVKHPGFPGSSIQIRGAIELTDGRILVFGSITTSDNTTGMMVRYLASGALDQTFGNNGFVMTAPSAEFPADRADVIYNAVVECTDKSLLGSGQLTVSSSARLDGYGVVAHIENNGTYRLSFNGGNPLFYNALGYAEYFTEIAVQRDDKIVAVGPSNQSNTASSFLLVRFNPDGSRDTSFGEGGRVVKTHAPGVNSPGSILLEGDTSIIVAGLHGVSTDDVQPLIIKFRL